MDIKRSIDIEDTVRSAFGSLITAYCRPLPANYVLPNILVTQVGGSDTNTIDTFEIVLDSRAKTPAEALETLRNAVGILRQVAADQSTAIRYVQVNSSGSWGQDPARPDLALCSARLRVVAHLETITI